MQKNKRKREKQNEKTKVKLERNNQSRGITLIALVVTIVVLIILATISINAIFSENGIIRQAEKAKEMTANSTIKEEENLNTVLSEFTNQLAEKPEESGGDNTEEPGGNQEESNEKPNRGLINGFIRGVDANGNKIDFSISDVSVPYYSIANQLKDKNMLIDILGDYYEEGISIGGIIENTTQEIGQIFPITVVFSMVGILQSTKTIALIYDEETNMWETTEIESGDGTVEFAMNYMPKLICVLVNPN